MTRHEYIASLSTEELKGIVATKTFDAGLKQLAREELEKRKAL